MKKFNQYEMYLITEGLKLLGKAMKKEIEAVEADGRMPLMTQGYVDMTIENVVEKVKELTSKK